MNPARAVLRARLVGPVRRVARASGPWPAARTSRALAAMLLAGAVAGWAVAAEPRTGGLLGLPAFSGLLVLTVTLVRGRPRPLGMPLAFLGVATAGAVLAVDAPAPTVASLGAALVAVHELSRWSIERRIDPPAEQPTERRRWLHLGGVVALGWLVGVGVVVFAAGRLDLAVWQAVLGALAAVAVAVVVAAAASGRLSSSDGSGAW